MNRDPRLSRRFAVCMLAALAVAACSTAPLIRRDTNPDARFGQYHTFAFFTPLATDKSGYETVLSTRLKAAARRAMEARGYVHADSNPDLRLNFYVNVEERQEIVTAPDLGYHGYYGYRRGLYGGFDVPTVQTLSYRQGTLAIDVVDTARRLLAWQATAEGIVSEEAQRDPGAAIDAIVAELMAPLPPAAR